MSLSPAPTFIEKNTSSSPLIYIATSHSNPFIDQTVSIIKSSGCIPYDFRNNKFKWKNVNIKRSQSDLFNFLHELVDASARQAFRNNLTALSDCQGLILLLPAGNSSHIEAGYTQSRNIPTCIYAPGSFRAELMYLLIEEFTVNEDTLQSWLEGIKNA